MGNVTSSSRQDAAGLSSILFSFESLAQYNILVLQADTALKKQPLTWRHFAKQSNGRHCGHVIFK